MFRRLGLVPGPDFASGVAAALSDTTPEAAEELLETVIDAHLLEAASTPGRYRFHDLLRLYAREQLKADETSHHRDAARRRMLEWYLDTARGADRLLVARGASLSLEHPPAAGHRPFTTYGQALVWFEVERVSLVAATRLAADCGLHAIAWHLADALYGFFYYRRTYLADWQDTHETGLAAARQAGNRAAEAWMLTNLGGVHWKRSRYEESIDCYGRV